MGRGLMWVALGLVVVLIAALVYGSLRWRTATKVMLSRLEAARLPIEVKN
jgi:hypothetical protein